MSPTRSPSCLHAPWRTAVCTLAAALALAGCGGGDKVALQAQVAAIDGRPYTPPQPSISDGIGALANRCVSPRTGSDPTTGQPWPDVQGTVAHEKAWVGAWLTDSYLWYDELPALNPASYSSPVSYFYDMKTSATTSSGKPKDQFHFAMWTSDWQAQSQSGTSLGYGVDWSSTSAGLWVRMVEPTAPQGNLAMQRGMRVTQIDGKLLASYSSSELSNLLYPSASGEQHQFSVIDTSGTEQTITLTAATVAANPVQLVHSIDSAALGGKIGYMLFNSHNAVSEQALIDGVTQLKADNVKALVLDLRYNGGGYLAIASELAAMIADPALSTDKVFERLTFNTKHSADNSDTPFYTTAVGFSATKGATLPNLGLKEVTVLTTADTCSASEAIINGLRGAGVKVNTIGSTTCGKPYGFYPTDNCSVTYFAIQFKGVNAAGFGDYADGFAPTCAAVDDLGQPLGNASEKSLAQALNFMATGQCSTQYQSVSLAQRMTVRSNAEAAAGLNATSAPVVPRPRTVFETNRILGLP